MEPLRQEARQDSRGVTGYMISEGASSSGAYRRRTDTATDRSSAIKDRTRISIGEERIDDESGKNGA